MSDAALPPRAGDLIALKRSLSLLYDVVEKEVHVNGTLFHVLKVNDTNTLVDAVTPEEFSEDERLPYWAELWQSSIILAQSCLAHLDLRGKRVLELGCGLGLAGIAAAKAGALVTLSDYESHALQFAQYNAFANLTEEELPRIEFRVLDWRKPPPVEPFDVIIAADCVYERRNFFPLIDVLNTLLKKDGIAIFAEPGRTIGELFFTLVSEEGFTVQTSCHPSDSNGKHIDVVQAAIRHLPGAST